LHEQEVGKELILIVDDRLATWSRIGNYFLINKFEVLRNCLDPDNSTLFGFDKFNPNLFTQKLGSLYN
jgi:hypothetical protein